MKLSDNEMKMLRYLRQQHEHWRSTRAIILVGSVVILVVGIFGLIGNASVYALMPLIALGLYLLSYAVGSPGVRPEISLLLRLVEEHIELEDREESDVSRSG